MTKKDLIKQLKSEGKSYGHVNKERILSQIPRQEQTKSRFIHWHPKLAMTFSLILLVVVGIALFRQSPVTSSIITIDINPSIELTVNNQDEVIGYRALNLDGEVLIETLNIQNTTVIDAIEEIMNQARELGYMTDASIVRVWAYNNQTKQESALNERIKSYFAQRIETIEISDDVINQAKIHGVTPGKWILIQSILSVDSSYTLETLLAYDVPRLNEIKRAYIASEVTELRQTIENYKSQLDIKKAELFDQIHDYMDEIRTEVLSLKSLYNSNLVEFNSAYEIFSSTYFPNAQIPLLPSIKYQRLMALEPKLDGYEQYLQNQVEVLYQAHIKGLFTYLVDTHANLIQLGLWQMPNQSITMLTSIELYVDASPYDQLFLGVAKRLDVLLSQTNPGSGIAHQNLLTQTYNEFMFYYQSDLVSSSLKTSNYIQSIIERYPL